MRAFTGNEYIQDLAAGNIVACEAWSGDVIQAQFDNPAHQVGGTGGGPQPLERQHAGADLAQHQTNAEAWMNYYYQPDVAANSLRGSTTSVPSRVPRRRWKDHPSLVENSWIFLTEEILA